MKSANYSLGKAEQVGYEIQKGQLELYSAEFASRTLPARMEEIT
jgi:hypothetical protein